MADAKCMDDWDHSSALLALIFNINRDPHSRAVEPSELNPYRAHKKSGTLITKDNVKDIKALWLGQAKPGHSSAASAPLAARKL